jgi:two-component system, NarL family, sensor kinase
MKTLIKERQKRIHYDRPMLPERECGDRESRVQRRIALIDSAGNIVAVNDDWMLHAKENGASLNRIGTGMNYLELCHQTKGVSVTSRRALLGIEAVLKGKVPSFSMDYSCQTRWGLAYFRMSVAPVVYENARVAIAHTDITDLRISKEEEFKRLREFARRLINAQEEERQRLSRELHDDLGHRIALLSFSVSQVIKHHSKNTPVTIRDLNKILEGITDFSIAVRNLSHHLCPPSLRYLGIGAALKGAVEEFEGVYGIRVELAIPPETPRLAAETELSVFRILQESLQNIAKHSGANKVKIVLENKAGELQLTISDTGRGFNRSDVARRGGLGLVSMEERALSIGAQLHVTSSPQAGTEIRLSVPLQEQDVLAYA